MILAYNDTIVNPACAGMILTGHRAETIMPRKPRVCGDDPACIIATLAAVE